MQTLQTVKTPCIIIWLLVIVLVLSGCASVEKDKNGAATVSEAKVLSAAPDDPEAVPDDSDSGDDWEKKEKIEIRSAVLLDDALYYVNHCGVWKVESGQECVRLSANPGDDIITDGTALIYSYFDIEQETGGIRSINPDGSNDAEICKVPHKADLIAENDGRIYYLSADPESTPQQPISSLFSFDRSSKESKVAAQDVFRCSDPVNGRIVYMDSGGSEFSLVGKLHVLDLLNGTDNLINDVEYDKGFFRADNMIYAISSTGNSDNKHLLCSYDISTSESKEVCTLLEGDDRKGIYPVTIYDHCFIYAVEDYDVTNGDYTYYRFDTVNNEVSGIEGLPHSRASLSISEKDAYWSFDDGLYSYQSSKQVSAYTAEDSDPMPMIFHDQLYQVKDDGSLTLLQDLS